MGILSFLARRRAARFAARAAHEVAERSHAAVLGRVRRRATTMRIAEARGYVRARALEIVHRELAAVHQGKIKLEPAVQTEIISQATEAVVVRVLAELRSVPKAAKPGRHAA
jgi:hypothetical protein